MNGAYPQFAWPSVRMGGHVNGAYLQFAWPGPLDPGSPKSHQKPRLGAPNLETCTFWGVQTWKPAGPKPGKLHLLGGPNLETSTFWGVQTWKPARFGTWKPARLGGPNLETSTFWGGRNRRQVSRFWTPKRAGAQVSRFGPAKTCRFPGLDPPKRADWTPQTCRFAGLQVGPPPNVGLDPPKRRFGGFQVWTPKTCRFPGSNVRAGFQVWPLNVQVSTKTTFGGSKPGNLHVLGGRFGGSKPGNLHVLGSRTCTFWGPNLETCTFWGVQTWKPARFRGPNLETCTFGGSKPGNLPSRKSFGESKHIRRVQNMRASVCLGLSGFLEPNRTEPKTHRTARNRNRRTNRTATNRRPANRNEPNRTGTLLVQGLGSRAKVPKI